ncbi:MAG: hypothetical protein J5892_02600 [Bacilli bacterium]|nr:hypothetical protein [Bacilli bacterium]
MINIMDSWYMTSTFGEVIKFLLFIDSIIYWLIARCFSFIIDVAATDFLLTDLVNQIINRTYIIVGVFALFLVSYALIKGLFDPDSAFKGKNSVTATVKNLLLAIVLVALMPTIFQYMYRFQSIVVNNNIIGSIVMGNDAAITVHYDDPESDGYITDEITIEDIGYENYIKLAGNKVAFTALNSFLYTDDEFQDLKLEAGEVIGTWISPKTSQFGIALNIKSRIGMIISQLGEKTFNDVRNRATLNGDFLSVNGLAYVLSTGFNKDSEHQVAYFPLVSTLCGIVMLVLIVGFCVNIVIRVFNLFLLELISPIASFSLIIPNSKVFDNWFKEVLKEYLDVFIRLATFNLMLLFFTNYNAIVGNVASVASSSFQILNIFFIIGLLIFINEAPKIMKDIFGIKESKKIKDRLFTGAVASTLGAAAGFAGGLVAGGVNVGRALGDKTPDLKPTSRAWNVLNGAGSGFVSGSKAGSKAKNFGDLRGAIAKNVSEADARRTKGNLYRFQHGNTIAGVIGGLRDDAVNYVTNGDPFTRYKDYEAQQGKVNDIKKDIDSIYDLADKGAAVSAKKSDFETHKSSLLSRDDFLHNTRDTYKANMEQRRKEFEQMTRPERASYSTDADYTAAYQAWWNKKQEVDTAEAAYNNILNDVGFQDKEYREYMRKFEAKAQKLETDYKTERLNWINKQAADQGSEVHYKYNKIKSDLAKQVQLNNRFTAGINVDNYESDNTHTFTDSTGATSSVIDVNQVLSDIKDDIFGKSEIYNSKVQLDKDFGSLKGIDFSTKVFNEASDFAIPLSTKTTKIWNSTEGKYDINTFGGYETAIVDLIASKKGLSKEAAKAFKKKFKEDNAAALTQFAKDAVEYYNARAADDMAAATSAQANWNNFFTATAVNPADVTMPELMKELLKVNAGTSRPASNGNVQKVHNTEDYRNAFEQAQKAYEQQKDGK